MKSFNARKTCKEHYLFKHKRRKLSLTNKEGQTGVFVAYHLVSNDYLIGVVKGSYYVKKHCFKQLNKILKNTIYNKTITEMVSWYEYMKKQKIEKVGLKRKDFSKLHRKINYNILFDCQLAWI